MCRSKVPAWGRDNLAALTDETPPARLWTRPSADSRTRGSSCRSQSINTVNQGSDNSCYLVNISLHTELWMWLCLWDLKGYYLSLLSLDTRRDFSSRYFSITALLENKKEDGCQQKRSGLVASRREEVEKWTVEWNKHIIQDKLCCSSHLPSDDTTLQIVELDELPEATGVVILCSPSIAKGLFKTQGGTQVSVT